MKKSGFRKGFIRELKRCLFNRNLFLVALISPVFYLFFYGSVYLHNVSTKLNVGVLDYDRSQTSRHFSRNLTADGVVHLTSLESTVQAKRLIESGALQGYIILPPGMEADLKSGRRSVLTAYINNNSFLASNELNKRFSTLVETVNTAVLIKFWQAKGLSRAHAYSKAMPLRIDISPLGNAAYGYSSFLYIAIFILILHQLALLSMCMTLADEKENNRLNSWKTSAGNNTLTMLLSKTAPYFILHLLYFLMMIVLAYPLFNLPVRCALWKLLLFALPFYLAVNAVAWLLGSFFRTMLQAFQLIVVSSMPLILLSGYTWPVYALPLLLKPIPYFLPAYPMMLGLQSLTQTGAGLHNLTGFYLLLWIHVVFYGSLGYLRWNKIILTHISVSTESTE